MNLINAIESLLDMKGDSNQMGITLHPENGWGTNYGKHDLEDGAVEIISKDSLNEWARGFEWDHHQILLAAEWITENLGEWIREEENYTELMEAAL